LLRLDGAPNLLIDSGANSLLRFGESKAKPATLDAINITHFTPIIRAI
jgi:ribonuclease BN (tRNA processing enzyme)